MSKLPAATITAKLGLVVAVIVACLSLGSGGARADEYTATFTCTGTCTFAPSVTNNPIDFAPPSPTEIDLTLGGSGATLYLPSADLPTDIYNWQDISECEAYASGICLQYDTAILLEDLTTGSEYEDLWESGYAPETINDSGTLTFSAVATPEPSSALVLVAGLGLVLAVRKLLA